VYVLGTRVAWCDHCYGAALIRWYEKALKPQIGSQRKIRLFKWVNDRFDNIKGRGVRFAFSMKKLT